ncbi:hypothetical protein [Armatimonas sp.]|uniref:hypothetical protein n=1 Tax=Armatimonas sp. TaxID=1872638 RepID=UPI00286C757E|nr:hypothetical protein [Armatimonas sp.]
MKQLLTLATVALIAGTTLTASFAQDKMGKMNKMGGEKKMAGKMQCAECAKLTKKMGKTTECAHCKTMHAAEKAKMGSKSKMSGDKMGGKMDDKSKMGDKSKMSGDKKKM